MNHVVLIGNLTGDPEAKVTPKGMDISCFTLALNHYYKNSNGERFEETSFIEVETFGKTASICKEYLKKGKKIALIGRIRQKRWESSQGGKRSKVCVVAERIEFLSPKTKKEEMESTEKVEEEIPF